MYKDNHLIITGSKIKDALLQLTSLGLDAILFIVDINKKLLGSVTDGDLRRGLLNGLTIEDNVDNLIRFEPRFISLNDFDIFNLIEYRKQNFKIIPVLNQYGIIIDLINFSHTKSYLPVDTIVMAGGKGIRLKPLTDKTPKPLLLISNKPIIEYTIDRLLLFGVKTFWVSINYLGHQIKDYLNDLNKIEDLNFIEEDKPLGTIGSASLIKKFKSEYILLTNSDLLTNIDYEDFFIHFLKNNADISIVTIPYNITLPYAILETNKDCVTNISEKPTYTYYSNAGIYLIKKDCLNLIPHNEFYNTTDLIEKILSLKGKVISYPFNGYWLDIGTHSAYAKAEIDISHIKFE